VRRWLPVAMLVATAVVVQKVVLESRYDVSGHAAEHLAGATVPFAGFAIAAILLYATPRARSQALVLAASAMWLASTVLVLVGNIRVVDALVDAGMANTPTSQLVENSKISSAHDLANLAPWLGVVSALVLIGALWHHRHISNRVAIGAAVLSVVFPPWIFPGAGVLVVTIARCIALGKSEAGHERVGTTGDLVTCSTMSSDSVLAEMNHVACIESVRDTALVEDDQATVGQHIERSPDHR
jgi:hypothetical protein